MAWDGAQGMLVVYARSDKRDIAAALKVWSAFMSWGFLSVGWEPSSTR